MLKNILSHLNKDMPLPADLRNVIDSGFQETDGGYLIGLFSRCAHTPYSVDKFLDRTGYECFLNSLRTEDYFENNLLSCSLLIIHRIFDKWRQDRSDICLNAVLSISDSNYYIKFHVTRPDEKYLADDLESYACNAVIELNSEENIL